jgi:lipooligosaccharide transport system ATP-binding protein
MEAIVARDLSCHFGPITALDNFSLNIPAGSCFGLLGPNGAGKSTFISMVYGARQADKGSLHVLGHPMPADGRMVRRRLGVVLQDNALDQELTVEENMHVYANFHRLSKRQASERIGWLLEFMALEHRRKARIRELSGGMQRRLAFVRALLHDPEVVILDEPTTGLDPAVRHLLWSKVEEFKAQGRTILLTTHYMDEAEVLCDHLAIMNQGRMLDQGSPRALIDKHCPGVVALFSRSQQRPDTDRSIQEFLAAYGLEQMQEKVDIGEASGGWFLRLPGFSWLNTIVEEIGTPRLVRPASLEDVYLKLTGKELQSNA